MLTSKCGGLRDHAAFWTLNGSDKASTWGFADCPPCGVETWVLNELIRVCTADMGLNSRIVEEHFVAEGAFLSSDLVVIMQWIQR